MKLDARIQALENQVKALLAIIEKQNETQAQMDRRVTVLEQRKEVPSETSYKPLFDRWPGNVG